jgi:hypothetical protein
MNLLPLHRSQGLMGCILLLSVAVATAAARDAVRPSRLALPPTLAPDFVENAGQWNGRVLAAARLPGVLLVATVDGVGLQFEEPADADGRVHGHAVWLYPEGNEPLSAEFQGPRPGRIHWISDRPATATTFGTLLLRTVADGTIWRVQFDASARSVEFARLTGASRWRLAAGDTAVRQAGGGVAISALERSISLRAADACLEDLLAVDALECSPPNPPEAAKGSGSAPAFSFDWSTFVVGSGLEDVADVAMGLDGHAYCTGQTTSSDFVTTPGAYLASGGGIDAYVLKVRVDSAELVFSTLLGSDAEAIDRGHLISARPDGAVVVVGQAGEGFPTTPGAYDTTNDGLNDFLLLLAPDGSRLLASTFFGGFDGGHTDSKSLAIEADGSPIIVGVPLDDTLPVTAGAFQPTMSVPSDGFVCVFSPDLAALEMCTYLGGNDNDSIVAVAVARDGSLLLGGDTSSTNFPLTPGAYDTDTQFDKDAFAARLSADGTTLLASTLLGATREERGLGIAEGPAGEMILGGRTFSDDFPLSADAFQATSKTLDGFTSDGFLSVISGDATTLKYSTYINTFGRDEILTVRSDPSGVISVHGVTSGTGLPTTVGALSEVPLGVSGLSQYDLFALRFAPGPGPLIYGSYFGSNGSEDLSAISDMEIGPYGELVLGSSTNGFLAPGAELGPFDPPPSATQSGLLGVLTMLPEGVSRYGEGTTGPDGPVALGVLSIPALGEASFGITSSNAPRHAVGLLALSADFAVAPITAAGIELWLDPAELLVLLPVVSDMRGWSKLRIAVPDSAALEGTAVYAQSFWPQGTSVASWRASNALRIVVQPDVP